MEAHMALQKLTTTKVMMVSHCSFVKLVILLSRLEISGPSCLLLQVTIQTALRTSGSAWLSSHKTLHWEAARLVLLCSHWGEVSGQSRHGPLNNPPLCPSLVVCWPSVRSSGDSPVLWADLTSALAPSGRVKVCHLPQSDRIYSWPYHCGAQSEFSICLSEITFQFYS